MEMPVIPLFVTVLLCCIATTHSQPTTKVSTTQPTTKESTTQPTTKESTTQPTTKESTTQPTTKESTTQPTTKESTTQPTTKESTTQPTTKESTTQSTTKESTTQPTTKESITQPTTKESTTQPTTRENTTQPTTKENTTQLTTKESTTHPTTTETTTHPMTTETTENSLDSSERYEASTLIIRVTYPKMKPDITLTFSIKFNQSCYNDSLQNTSSPYFRELANQYEPLLTSAFNKTDNFRKVRITGFWNGSIGITYDVLYASEGLTLTSFSLMLKIATQQLMYLDAVDQDYINGTVSMEIIRAELLFTAAMKDPCSLPNACGKDQECIPKTDISVVCTGICKIDSCVHGACIVDVDKKTTCSCYLDDSYIYWGETCGNKAIKPATIIAIAAGAGGGLVLLLLIALVVTCCRQNNAAKKTGDIDQKSEASFQSLNVTNGMALMPDGTAPSDDISNSRLYRDTKPREDILRQPYSASKMEASFTEDMRTGDDGRLYRVMKERDLHTSAPAESSFHNKAFESTEHPDHRDSRKEVRGNRQEPSSRKSSLYSVVDKEGGQYHIYQPPDVSSPRFTPDTPTPLSHYSLDPGLSTRPADDLQRGYDDRQRSDASRRYSDVLKPSFSSTPRSEPGLVYAPVQARLDRPSYRDNPRPEQDRFQRQHTEQKPAYPIDIYTHSVKRNSDTPPAVLDYSNPTSKNFGSQPSRYVSNQGSRPTTPPLAYTNERYVPSDSSAAQRSQIYDYERGPIQRKPRMTTKKTKREQTNRQKIVGVQNEESLLRQLPESSFTARKTLQRGS